MATASPVRRATLATLACNAASWLARPGTNFDIILYQWNPTTNNRCKVAESTSPGSVETISYSGSAGRYLWVIQSWNGGGAYTFWLGHP